MARKETLTTCYPTAHISGRPHTVSLTPSQDMVNHTLEIGTRPVPFLSADHECPDSEALWPRVKFGCYLLIFFYLKNFRAHLIIKRKGNNSHSLLSGPLTFQVSQLRYSGQEDTPTCGKGETLRETKEVNVTHHTPRKHPAIFDAK